MSFEIVRTWQSSTDPAFVHYVIRGAAMPERHLREPVHTHLGRYLITGLRNAVTGNIPSVSSPTPPPSPPSTSAPPPTPPFSSSSPPAPTSASMSTPSPSPAPPPPSLSSPEEISRAAAFHFLRTQAGLIPEELF